MNKGLMQGTIVPIGTVQVEICTDHAMSPFNFLELAANVAPEIYNSVSVCWGGAGAASSDFPRKISLVLEM